MGSRRLVLGALWALGGFVFGYLAARQMASRDLNTYRGIIQQNQQRNIDHIAVHRSKRDDETK